MKRLKSMALLLIVNQMSEQPRLNEVFISVDRTVQELGDDTDRSSDAGSTSSRTTKRKKTVKKKKLIEVDSGDEKDEKPKKKKPKTNEKVKAKKGKKKGWLERIKLDLTGRHILCYFHQCSFFCFWF